MIFITITSHPDNLNLRGTFQYRTGLNAPAIASGQLEGRGYFRGLPTVQRITISV